MNIINGQKGPWPQPTSYGRNDAGQFSVVPFESTDADSINRLAAQFDALGYNYNVEHSFGKSKITLQLAFNWQSIEAPVDVWEYAGQEAQKDLLSASVPSGITGTLTATAIKLIKKVANGTYPTDDTTPIAQSDFTDGTKDQNENAFIVAQLAASGYLDAIVQVPIIRHTQVVSFVYPITLSKLNVGRVITTSSLIAMENPPSWAVTGLPNDMPPTFVTLNLAYGWRKCPPTIQTGAYRKTQIIQEFQYGLWPLATMGVNGQFL